MRVKMMHIHTCIQIALTVVLSCWAIVYDCVCISCRLSHYYMLNFFLLANTLDVRIGAVTSVINNDDLRVCFEVRAYQLNEYDRDGHICIALNGICLFRVV